jgi:hypothetical protein
VTSPLRRRLARLEQQRAVPLRQRIVWWHVERGEPEPKAEPGEQLIIVHWMLPDEAQPVSDGTISG